MNLQPSADPPLRRVAMLSVHTSPLARPGSGDAGGMNVYVLETARRLARRGIEVEVFTRRTSSRQPDIVEVEPGLSTRHIDAGPYEGLAKDDLPGQLCAFTAGVMLAGAALPPGYFDLVHSHYWLSGQVGWLAADRWHVPLVHSMHTMAKVKNADLAVGDDPEPRGRIIGEEQVVTAADQLIANTPVERDQLIQLYGADPDRVSVVPPGVDLEVFRVGDRAGARVDLDVPADADIVLFVGRLQPLKAPDLAVRAVARMLDQQPERRARTRLVVLGGPSGSGLRSPDGLAQLAAEMGVADVTTILPPVERAELAQWYRAADVLLVPSYNESFGLVALEALACGLPVIAAAVGGLPVAVGPAGILLTGHDDQSWADALAGLLADPSAREKYATLGPAHAAGFGWERTVDVLLDVYRAACGSHRRRRELIAQGRTQ